MTPLTLATSTAYFRGQFVPFAEANVSIASSPFLYGLAIYTVFSATYDPEHKQLYLFRLRDHYDRLVNAARIMDFEDFGARYSYETFEKTMLELVARNDIREDALIRAMVFIDELAAGTRIHGLKNEMAVYVYPMGEIMPRTGAHVGISSWTRTGDNMMPSRAKVNGSYINASLMKNEAIQGGYDEAIALDSLGHVAEGTVANIFIVRGGQLITPDTSTDILEGITRDSIIQIAAELDIPVIERAIDRTELYIADEALFVGSSARVTPIISIDKRTIGGGQPGPITQRLTRHYDDLQHGLLSHDWLTKAYSE